MDAIIEHPHFTDTTATSSEGRFTVLTANRQADFLKSLQLFGNVRLACRAATISAQTAYRARRSSPGFALAWDAALLAARAQAEAVLADRAINGVEEAVYYHGEEVARRKRYDSRLLLAHLARLDRLESREEVTATLPLLDAAIEALCEGGELDRTLGAMLGPKPVGDAGAERAQDSVPCVPSCRTPPSCSEAIGQPKTPSSSEAIGQPRTPSCSEAVGQPRTPSSSEAVGQTNTPPCPDCGGACEDPAAELTRRDCQWLGNRLARMEAARPESVPTPEEAADTFEEADRIEEAQLAAFEAGEERWWKAEPEPEGEADLAPGEPLPQAAKQA